MARQQKTPTEAETETVKPSLDGVLARIERAEEHLENMRLVLGEFDSTQPAKFVLRQDETEEREVTAVLDDVAEVPWKVRLLIGEVAHAIAGSLDNLAFQLSLSHQIAIGATNPLAVCEKAKTYFPIFATSSPDDLRRIERRLKLMAPEPADIIRDMQPYKRGDEAARQALWVIYQLDVIDKHRVVLAVTQSHRLHQIAFGAPSKEPQVFDTPNAVWQPMKKGVEILRLTMPEGTRPQPGLNLNLKVARRIHFAETNLCDGHNVLYILRELISFVRTDIIDRLARYVG